MPDINFAKLFSILGIGLFTLLCVFYLRFIWFKLFSTKHKYRNATVSSEFLGFFEKIKKIDIWISGFTIASFTLLFGFGTIIHELVHKITVTDKDQPKYFIEFKKSIGLKLKEDIILNLLVDEENKDLTAFGIKIFSNDSIINTVNHTLNHNYFKYEAPDDIHTYWLKHRDEFIKGKENKKRFKSYIDEIAFLSKNWCYLCTDRVAEELSSIDDKTNFSRCVATVSFCFLAIITPIVIVFMVRRNWRKYVRKEKLTPFNYSSLLPLGLLFFLFCAAVTSYPISQDNFNKRILGYYLNHFSYHTDFK